VKLNGATDMYTFTMLKDIDDGSHRDFTNVGSLPAGQNAWNGFGTGVGDANSQDLLFTSKSLATGINTSSSDIGSGDQWIDGNEGVRMDFVTGLTGTTTTNNGFDFAHHYEVNDYQFAINQVNGGSTTSVRLTAANATLDANVGAVTEANFTAQTLQALTAGELTIIRGGADITNNKALITIDYTDAGKNDGGVIISGLDDGDVIKIHDDGGFNRVEIDNNASKQFSINGMQVLHSISGHDVNLQFETTLTDSDGDTSSGQYIGIKVETNDGENHTFNGGAGNDTIQGGSGNDFIFGNAGNDSMLFDAGDKYDGGAGFDRLVVATGGNSITYDKGMLSAIEMIDLGDGFDRSGAPNQNTLALNAADVTVNNFGTVNGHTISLFVIGDTTGTSADKDNVVMTGGFTKLAGSGSLVDDVTGVSHTYDVYQAGSGAKVAIEQGLDVT
jgi:hypothetical protein